MVIMLSLLLDGSARSAWWLRLCDLHQPLGVLHPPATMLRLLLMTDLASDNPGLS